MYLHPYFYTERRYRRALQCALANKKSWYSLSNGHVKLATLLKKEFDKDYTPGWQCIVSSTGFNRMNADIPESYFIPIPQVKVDVLLFHASTPSIKISG